jgi:ABC-type branched-subunit amino acid transport system ATPase component
MNDNLFVVEDLTIGYSGMPVLENINLHVSPGEVVGILGRNGSGKSTLIRTIAGLLKEIKGKILVNKEDFLNQSVSERVMKTKLGCLLQHNRNTPNLTVRENLHLSQWSISSWTQREISIRQILSREPFNQLNPSLDELSNLLSGGQDLLLAIASLLLQKSEIILLDEPSDGLDESNRNVITELIIELKKEGKAIIMVEQLLRVLFSCSDRVYVIKSNNRDKRNCDDLGLQGKRFFEMEAKAVRKIREIYEKHPVLSSEHPEMIDSLIWHEAGKTHTV